MADEADMKRHVATYDGIIAMLKWSSVAVAVIALAVIWLISRHA